MSDESDDERRLMKRFGIPLGRFSRFPPAARQRRMSGYATALISLLTSLPPPPRGRGRPPKAYEADPELLRSIGLVLRENEGLTLQSKIAAALRATFPKYRARHKRAVQREVRAALRWLVDHLRSPQIREEFQISLSPGMAEDEALERAALEVLRNMAASDRAELQRP